MKYATNKTRKIVIIGDSIIRPDETEKVPEAFEDSTALADMVRRGDIVLSDNAPEKPEPAPAVELTAAPTVQAQSVEDILGELKKMQRKSEVQALAADLEIEFEDSTTIKELKAAITAKLTGADGEDSPAAPAPGPTE